MCGSSLGLLAWCDLTLANSPFMVAVATKVDAPIKLVFANKKKKAASILGLGDIVVPGILMSLALRFDLYLHYARRITHEPAQMSRGAQEDLPPDSKHDQGSSVTPKEQTPMLGVKIPFTDPRGQWGNRLWTMGSPWTAVFGWAPPQCPVFALTPGPARQPRDLAAAYYFPQVSRLAASFPNTYFYACAAGYVLGMLATLVAVRVSGRGQPALLYLVPGVVGAIWLTALLRGELGEAWRYTEDGSLDTKDVLCEVGVPGERVCVEDAPSLLAGGMERKGEERGSSDEKGGAVLDQEPGVRAHVARGRESSPSGLRLRDRG